MTNVDRVYAEAMQLTGEQRAELLDRLVTTEAVNPDIEKAWMEEAERRFHAHESGQVRSIPWEEAEKRIFSR